MLRGTKRTEEIRINGSFKREPSLLDRFMRSPYRLYIPHILNSDRIVLETFLKSNKATLCSMQLNLRGIFVAIEYSRMLQLHVLLNFFDISTFNQCIVGEYNSQTPIIFAASRKKMAACNMLLSKGVELQYSDMFGKVAIDYVTFDDKLRQAFIRAASRQLLRVINIASENLINILIYRCFADTNFPDDHGNTALHKAAAACHIPMVCLLLRAGASVQELNKNDDTPYDRVPTLGGENAEHVRRILRNTTVLERVT